MIKFTLLLFFSFLLCSIAGPVPEDGENQHLEDQIGNNLKRRKTGFEKVRDIFFAEEGVKRKLNKTDKDPIGFDKTVTIKHEGIDLSIDMNEKKTYYGHDIDVDYESDWTSNTTFTVDVDIYYYGRKEEYDVGVIGQIEGKQINETGKLIFRWDTVRIKFLADCEESLFLFRNISMGFNCIHPTVKAVDLSIADQFEKPIFYMPIFNKVMDFWRKEFQFGQRGQNMMNLIGDLSACVKK